MKAPAGSRRVALASVAAIAALVLTPAAASAHKGARSAESSTGAPPTTTYLALGDSISYGYSEERFNKHFPNESPSYFEEGFTNGFTKDLAKSSEVGKSIRLVNDACPGETSNGLIGENTELGGEASTESIEEVEGKPTERFPEGGYQGLGDWHPCKYTFVNHLPLHNGGYINEGKEVSQLEEAVSLLTTNDPLTGKPEEVKAITLNIGSNDELAAIKQCEDEVAIEFGTKGTSKYGSSPTSATITCIKETAEHVTVPHIIENLDKTLGALEHVYAGPIVLLGFYNPDADVLPGSDELQEGTNAAVVADVLPEHKHTTFANPFPVFNNGAGTNGAKETKSICKYTEMCNPNDPGGSEGKGDIHPSVVGYKELAKLVNAAYLENAAK